MKNWKRDLLFESSSIKTQNDVLPKGEVKIMRNKLSINRLHHYFKPKGYTAQLLLCGMGEGAYQECSYFL